MSGGIRVVSIYANLLASRGHQVVLVSPPLPTPTFRQRLRNTLRLRPWPKEVGHTKSHLDGLGLDHRVLSTWRPICDADVPDADVVIATWWETAEWVYALSPSKGAKAYFIQHHEVFEYLPLERVRQTYRLPLHKITIASWLVDVMGQQYGDRTVDRVPNAVDHSLFFAPVRGRQDRPTLGFLHHNTAFKGVEISIAAAKAIRTRIPDLRIISFGSNAPDDRLKLGDDVEFHLAPPQEQLRELYAQCDVWFATSHSEGFNLPVMEAMACRTPVVSTRTGWPLETIKSGKNGMLVDVGDVEGVVDGALWILGLSEPKWMQLSQGAFDTVAGCNWAASTELFESALEHARSRAVRGEVAGRSS